jgi:aquaporin Z
MSQQSTPWSLCLAESMGTMILVLGGCGSAVIAANFPINGIGLLGVSFGFGLSLLAAIYLCGDQSGGHFNPAVTVGFAIAGRLSFQRVMPYIVSQVLGGIIGAGILLFIASGKLGFNLMDGLAANGYAGHSPGSYTTSSALVAEIIFTAIFVGVVLAATRAHQKRSAMLAPVIIALTLTLIHLVLIPVTNASVNPARSTGPAIYVQDWALSQLWLFWLAPMLGGVIAGFVERLNHKNTVHSNTHSHQPDSSTPVQSRKPVQTSSSSLTPGSQTLAPTQASNNTNPENTHGMAQPIEKPKRPRTRKVQSINEALPL